MILRLLSDYTFINSTEEFASQKIKELLPDSNNYVYIDFPWSDLFESGENLNHFNGLDSWQHAVASLKNILFELKPSKVVTSCAHSGLLQHLSLMENIGITQVYWTEAIWLDSIVNQNNKIVLKYLPHKSNFSDVEQMYDKCNLFAVKLMHFNFSPSLQANYKYQNLDISNGDLSALPSSYFCFIDSDVDGSSQLLWDCIECSVIPVFLKKMHLVHAELWQSASLTFELELNDSNDIFEKCRAIIETKNCLDSYLQGIKQLRFLYGRSMFVYDIIDDLVTKTSMGLDNVVFLIDLIVSSKKIEVGSIFHTSLVSKLLLHPEEVRNLMDDEIMWAKIKSVLNLNKLDNGELLGAIANQFNYSWLKN
ncbi:hypothetical protein [Paraglaciecola marina]|uniref:hypothetical protein n=1 Tax=Paraglaciecola marina TaxID=2500157 RepID=UPI00105C0737|nr:hypothetical protein [Paraglaciecola marina]